MRTSGKLSLSTPEDAARAPSLLNAFFHGSAHSELRNPFLISAWVGTNAQLVMHLNSVSSGAVINVRVDGTSVFTKTMANKDGGYDVNNEYNQDFPLSLSPGKHLIEVRNSGSDWFYLDWVRLENILPSQYANGWQPSPIATGMQNPGEALVYVVNPAINFPVNATNSNVALVTNGFLQVTNWVRGNINALWYDPSTGQTIGKSVGISSNNILLVPLPSFKEDLSGRLVPELKVQQVIRTNSALDLYLTAPLPAHAEIQASNDLRNWNSIADLEFNDQIVEVPLDLSHHSIFRFKTAE